jgi:hypothetical protein
VTPTGAADFKAPLACVNVTDGGWWWLPYRQADTDGTVQILRAWTDSRSWGVTWELSTLLIERGDLGGLNALADAGDGETACRLAELLAERGDLDGLRARADSGDWFAANRLADLLAGLLDEQGRSDEAEQLRQLGLNPDGPIG